MTMQRTLDWTLLVFLLQAAQGMRHTFHTFTSRQVIGPVGAPFGYFTGGHYELTVEHFALFPKKGYSDDIVDNVEAGFFLQKFPTKAAFNQYMEILKNNASSCSFDNFLSVNDFADDDFVGDDGRPDPLRQEDDEFNAFDGPIVADNADSLFLSMKNREHWQNTTFEYTFQEDEQGLYFLIYQVCPRIDGILSKFRLDFHFANVDRFGNHSYLSAGETNLPIMYFFFSMCYLICFLTWYCNIRLIQSGSPSLFVDVGSRPAVYAIHQLMTLLLIVKFLEVFFESIRFHYIKVTGHAEFWSLLYYFLDEVKTPFLFTVIALIGTGWSYAKPFLEARERRTVLVILGFQILNNIAIVFLSSEAEGEEYYGGWMAVLHLIDIICCCAVLFPVVWQVNALEKSMGLDTADESTVDPQEGPLLEKLKLFRTFYLIVVAYIYSTRILVYLFATVLDYKHSWVRGFIVEAVTLAFYVMVGFMFRPVTETEQPETNEEVVELVARPVADPNKVS